MKPTPRSAPEAAGAAPMTPWAIEIDLVAATMRAPERTLVRRASHMRGFYRDAAALERLIAAGDPVHYEVFERLVPEESGHLMVCLSRLQPGDVGGECFMTKGHFHAVAATGEVYLGLRGTGYMVMKTADGRKAAVPLARDRMVYVPPGWAHRSVNTGNEPLVSFCVYPAEAGHNYRDIAAAGFPQRIFVRAGQIEIREATP